MSEIKRGKPIPFEDDDFDESAEQYNTKIGNLETELAKYKKLATGMAEALNNIQDRQLLDGSYVVKNGITCRAIAAAALAEYRDAVKEKKYGII